MYSEIRVCIFFSSVRNKKKNTSVTPWNIHLFFVSLWSLLLTYVAQKSVFSPTRVQNVQLHFISCTLLENLKLCPKIQFSEKNNEIENLNIRAKNWWIIVILLEFEFWRQKLSFYNFQFLFIPIFGAKIQIIKATLAFKN